MSLVRRHLRRGVAVWLLSHALVFTALVPRDCCAAHRHGDPSTTPTATAAVPSEPAPCHEDAAPAPASATASAPAPGAHCDMPAGDGAACPMHHAPAPSSGCAMRGTCQAPAAALAAVLLQAAVLVPVTNALPLLSPAPIDRPADVSARSLASPPDAPPPRA